MRYVFLIATLIVGLGVGQIQANEDKSAFVSCMETKVKEIFQPPDSVMPMMRLQAQITERDYAELAKSVNESPTVIAELELKLEQGKSPTNHTPSTHRNLTTSKKGNKG
jgi:hypothetical protein